MQWDPHGGVQRGGANLNKKQAKAGAKEVKNTLAEDPKADQDKLFSEAWLGVLVVDYFVLSRMCHHREARL